MKKIILPDDVRFYINRNNYIESETHANIGVAGIYTCEAIKPGVGVVRRVEFANLITDIGMDDIGAGGSFVRMHLGTGTTPPTFGDSQLANFGANVLGTNGSDGGRGVSGSAPHYAYVRYTWTSAVGTVAGNWTEIGISSTNTNGNLRSRALIVDGSGTPITFPVQADEQFRGTYEMRLYAPTVDSVATIDVSGVSYDVTTRALAVNTASRWNFMIAGTGNSPFAAASGAGSQAMTGTLGLITDATPQGSSVMGGPAPSAAAYVNGTHRRDSSYRWGSGSAGTFRTISTLMNGCYFQNEYDRNVTKTSVQEFIHNQRVSWSRR